MADVNARERVRARLRQALADKGLSGRAFGKRLGHGDQWVSNLLNGKFALSLDELDATASIVGRTPSDLVRREEDELWELRPTEMRLVRAVRGLPPALRDHLVTLAEYLIGVVPDEIDFLNAYRLLTPEEQLRVRHGVDVLLATQNVVPKRENTESRSETGGRSGRGVRAVPRLTRGETPTPPDARDAVSTPEP